MGFGTGIVPEGWEFTLQNRGNNLSQNQQHPNALAPRKCLYHTIIPGILTRDVVGESATKGGEISSLQYELIAPFGVMGGSMQPQGHVQVVVGLVDDKLDPQAALDRPRFCLSEATPQSNVQLEEGIPAETMDALARMGHTIAPVSGYARAVFGRGQIIRREPDGTLWGSSDPRADGCAIGI